MIPSFEVRNYRLFRHLKIDKLARVNLITGKNNVGKTALLEAVRLYSTQAKIADIIRILRGREILADFNANDIKYIFNYNESTNMDSIRNIIDKYIIVGPKGENKELKIKFVGYSEKIENGGVKRFLDDLDSGAKPGLEVTFKRKSRILPLATDKDQLITYTLITDEPPKKCFYVPSNSLDMISFYEWWEGLLLTPKQNDIIQSLHIIEPDLQDIALKSGNGEKTKSFYAKLKNMDSPIPLSSLGEGIVRLLRIAIGLVSAKDDILCIDEFENGLHYSVQLKIWKFILDNAEKFNVQVFATTHNWDCIDSFQRALNEHHDPSIGQVIRLKERKGDIAATVFDAGELAIATREGLEVR